MSDTNYAQIKLTVTRIGVSLQDMTGWGRAAENQDKCCIWRKCWNIRGRGKMDIFQKQVR